MNILNVYLLLIGIFMSIMGIVWSKGNWINVFIKILYLVSGTYLILYTSAYDKRVEERKKKAKRKREADKIKKQMDKIIAEMDQSKRYEMYASDNPELAEKLKAYKELIGE